MEIVIRHPNAGDLPEWSRMRTALWPETHPESHAEEIAAFLSGDLTSWLAGLKAVAVFVAVRPDGGLCGFVEVSGRHMADGCSTQPVGYVEGWYVTSDKRLQGVGRKLIEAAQAWSASQGCREMASDADLANAASITAHKSLGFEEEAPTVRFRKWLPGAVGEGDRKVPGQE